jgi:hypothetical protein
MRHSSIFLAVVVMISGLISVPAMAQSAPPNPAEIARECVGNMHAVSVRACNAMKNTAEFGIRRMHRLNEEGAPDRVLREVAGETTARIAAIADAARNRINRITARCVRHLRSIGAPDAVIEFVLEGRKRSLLGVRSCAHRSSRAVRRAFVIFTRSVELSRQSV